MTRRVYKYGTGHPIPEGAVYLSTVTQTRIEEVSCGLVTGWSRCWLVWHYFLVESDT